MSLLSRLVLVAPVAALQLACATAMQIESTPSGAQVIFEDKPVGTTPMTLDVPAGGMGSSVEVTVKKGALQKTVTVPRSELDITGLAVGAGVDTAACLAIGGGGIVVGTIAAFVFPPCGFAPCLAPVAYLALPVQWFMFGYQPPKTLSVTLEPGATPAPPPIDGTSPPPSNYGY